MPTDPTTVKTVRARCVADASMDLENPRYGKFLATSKRTRKELLSAESEHRPGVEPKRTLLRTTKE
jgi:hypothetical protein